MKDIVVSALALSGAALYLLSSLGLLRLPDPMCRSHANAKGSCLGVLLILAAAGVAFAGEGVGLVLMATAVFQLLTIPIAAHLFGRLAYRKKIPLWKERPRHDRVGTPPAPGGTRRGG